MNVTFLIGNGFDLGLGLKTSYRDFLEYYKKLPSSSALIKKFKDNIAENDSTWADTEIAFGQYCSNFSTREEYEECHDDIIKCLSKYLSIQEKNFVIDESIKRDVANFLYNDLTRFHKKYLERKEKDSISNKWPLKNEEIKQREEKEYFSNIFPSENEKLNYSFLNFNYTQTFDKCLFEMVNLYSDPYRFERDYELNFYGKDTFEIEDMLHVHGVVNNALIFGVNDASQIAHASSSLRDNFCADLIKGDTSRNLDDGIFDYSCKAINESDIICVMGMSIGASDANWWERIIERMKNNKNVHLIVFYYDYNVNQTLARQKINGKKKVKKQFLSYLPLSEEQKEELKSRIFVSLEKPSIFSMTGLNFDDLPF